MSHLQIITTKSDKYPPRTFVNANNADITIAFAVDFNTSGEKLTKKAAANKYIAVPVTSDLNVETPIKDILACFNSKRCLIINIAGNSIPTLYKYGINQDMINKYIYEIFLEISTIHPIKEILCGGQTGVDLAGAIAGYRLNIPTKVTMPNGYITRGLDGMDRKNSYEEIYNNIIS
jgi:hypothetical protein